MKYLVVAPVEAYPIDDRRAAMESAFCEHLRELLALLSPPFDEMTVAAVRMSGASYARARDHLGVLDADRDRIRVLTLYDAELGHPGFLRALPSIVRKVDGLVRKHALLHSGPCHDLWRPVTSIALALAAHHERATISITDMDLRSDAAMNYRLRRWSLKSYLLCRYLYDPVRHLQHRWVMRTSSLVLFKSEAQRVDYGEGRPHVRLIRDPGFRARDVIGEGELARKIARARDPRAPLRAIYFGRLVYYKGADRCVEALARARALGRSDVELTIMGAGDEEEALRALVAARGLTDCVSFVAPLPYGDAFFAELRRHDLLLAAPLSNDTPRSAWDAMASGMPLLAFDTDFYRDLAETTGAVDTVPWPSAEALGDRLAEYAADRDALVTRMRRAVRVATRNTSETWLKRRAEWTRALLGEAASASPSPSGRRASLGELTRGE